MPEQGWYDDPQGGGGQRWWDGERWTEHTTPPPTNVPPPPVGGAPVGAPQADPGMVGTAGPTAGGYATAGTPGAEHTPAADAAGASGAKGGAGKLIAIIVGLLLLAGIAVVVVLLLTGDGDDVDLGTLRAGDSRQFEVPEDGEWSVAIDVPAGLLVIDARGVDGFDPIAELLDDADRQLDRNDDRTFAQQEEYGGGVFDSLIEIEVPAGTYRVVITGFASEGGSGVVSFPIVGG